MANEVTFDVFKFMSLRSPQSPDYENDIVTFIRDARIQDRYLPDETHDIAKDDEKFSKSKVGSLVFDQIKTYLPTIEKPSDIASYNNLIVEEVKRKFSIAEQLDRAYISEFVLIIKQHLDVFNKPELLRSLDDVAKKRFPKYSGASDYIEVVADVNSSWLCLDFEHLYEHLYALYVCKRRYPINLEYVIDGLRALHVIRFLKDDFKSASNIPRTLTDCAEKQVIQSGKLPKISIGSKEDLARLFSASPYIHQLFACLLGHYKPFNAIRPIGVGDLLVVKQFLCKYEAGEIAHVENVLKGEEKTRTHRVLDKTEDIFSRETEKSEETERELQTTDRYELKTETESTITNDLHAEMAGQVSGKYGVVEYSASAGVTYSLSTSDSRRSANNFAKDIVDRSLSRVQKRVREERTTKKTHEVEELNTHQLTNIPGTGHITGIYRWLDKHYKAQVYNYGKRLMFEFVIPEPAAFIAAAFERNKKKTNNPQKPSKPVFPALAIDQISKATVDSYAALYYIADLEPEPPDTMTVRSQPIQTSSTGTRDFTGEYIIDIPPGYATTSARVTGARQRAIPTPFGLIVTVGEQRETLGNDRNQDYESFDQTYDKIGEIREKLSIAILAYGMHSYAFNVVVAVKLTREKKRQWQINTYTKIMDAYQKLLAEYNSALSEYQDKLDGYEISRGILIQGRNTRLNQDIIQTELKKHCITMFAKQFDTDKDDDIKFDAMKSRAEQIQQETTVVTETKKVTQTIPVAGTTVTVTETTISESTTSSLDPSGIPTICISDAKEEGAIIQFLEQAFEWQQISYLLYPYFWGRFPDTWFNAQKFYDEEDSLFRKFLQAGSARILVAVRPAFELAVMHYLCTREPWNGGPAPGITHPLYIGIHEELRDQQDDLYKATPYGDPWPVVVPTSLVYLEKGSDLPVYKCDPPTL